MGKLDDVVGVQGNDEYNEGFNAGVSFVKTVIESSDFEKKLTLTMMNNPQHIITDLNKLIIETLKGYNL